MGSATRARTPWRGPLTLFTHAAQFPSARTVQRGLALTSGSHASYAAAR
jgi:hypothetical protein